MSSSKPSKTSKIPLERISEATNEKMNDGFNTSVTKLDDSPKMDDVTFKWNELRKKDNYHRRESDASVVLTEDTDSFIVGERVYVGGTKLGVIAFIGETKFGPGDWAGVVLDEPIGKNDGSVAGIRYFQCAPNRGIFSRLSRLSRTPVDGSSPTPRLNGSSPSPSPSPVMSTISEIPQPRLGNRTLSNLSSATKTSTASRVGGGDLKIGDRVIVQSSHGSKAGYLRYHGNTEFEPGLWCGVQLDDPLGKNDGSVNGVRYFTCEPKFGLFVPAEKVSRSPMAGKKAANCVVHTSGLNRESTQGSINSNSTFASSIKSSPRVRLGVNSLRQKTSTNASPIGIQGNKPPMQEKLKEKDAKIAQLQKEKELERLQMIKAATQAEEAEKKLSELRSKLEQLLAEKEIQNESMLQQVNRMEEEKSFLLQELEEERKRIEDLQFTYEEESITKSEMEVLNDEYANKVANLQKIIQEQANRIQQLINEKGTIKEEGNNEIENKALNELKENITQVERKNNIQNDKIKELEEYAKKSEDELGKIKEENESLMSNLEYHVNMVNQLSKKINDLVQMEKGDDDNDVIEKVITGIEYYTNETKNAIETNNENMGNAIENIRKMKGEKKFIGLENKLEDKVESIIETNLILLERISTLTEVINKKDEQITSMVEEMQQVRKEYVEMLKEKQMEIDEMKANTLKAILNDQEGHKSKIIEFEATVKQLKDEIIELTKEGQSIKESNQNLSDSKEEALEENLKLINKIQKMEDENVLLINEKQKMINENKCLAEEKQKLVDENLSLTNIQLKVKDGEMQKILDENLQLMNEKQKLIGDNQKLSNEKQKVEDDYSILTNEKQRMVDENEKLANEKQKVLDDNSILTNEKQRLLDENEKLTNEKLKLADESVEMTNEKHKILGDNSILTNEKQRLGDENLHLNNEKQKLVDENVKLANEKERLVEENEKLTNEKQKILEDSAILTNEKQRLVEENLHLTNEKQKVLDDNLILTNEKQKLVDENVKLTNEEQKVLEDNSILINEKERLVDENEKLTKEKQKVLEDNSILINEKQKMIDENLKIINEKDRLVSDNVKLTNEKQVELHDNLMLAKSENQKLVDENLQLTNEKQRLIDENLQLTNEKQKMLDDNLILTNDKQRMIDENLQLSNENLRKEIEDITKMNKIAISTLEKEIEKKEEIITKEKEKLKEEYNTLMNEKESVIKENSELRKGQMREFETDIKIKEMEKEIESLKMLLKKKEENECKLKELLKTVENKEKELLIKLNEEDMKFKNLQEDLFNLTNEIKNEKLTSNEDDDYHKLMQEKDFLNTVIVQLQNKNVFLEEKMRLMEQDDHSGHEILESYKSRYIAPRMFCDICDVFDNHETEDCPKERKSSTSPVRRDKPRIKPPERPYCESCEVFGHDTSGCNNNETF